VGALRRPSPHTTVRTVPYTAVHRSHTRRHTLLGPGCLRPAVYVQRPASLFSAVPPPTFGAVQASQPAGSALFARRSSVSDPEGVSCVRPFAAWCRTTTMASADFCRPIRSPCGNRSRWQVGRSPRVRRVAFVPYARRIYFQPIRMTIGLWVTWPPHPRLAASYAVRVPRAGALLTAS
jgi:hypothetical protein